MLMQKGQNPTFLISHPFDQHALAPQWDLTAKIGIKSYNSILGRVYFMQKWGVTKFVFDPLFTTTFGGALAPHIKKVRWIKSLQLNFMEGLFYAKYYFKKWKSPNFGGTMLLSWRVIFILSGRLGQVIWNGKLIKWPSTHYVNLLLTKY